MDLALDLFLAAAAAAAVRFVLNDGLKETRYKRERERERLRGIYSSWVFL